MPTNVVIVSTTPCCFHSSFSRFQLLNWRLIETGPKGKKSKAANAAAAGGGGVAAQNQEGLDASLSTSGAVEANNPLDGVLSAKKDGLADAASEATVTGGSNVADLQPGPALGSLGAVGGQQPEGLNKKALDIVQRVRDKLTGRDFNPKDCLCVKDQVDLLICQATNNENLCQCYIGWCPFW